MGIIKKLVLSILVLSMTWIIGCTPKDVDDGQRDIRTEENLELKIGVMPAVDSAPIFIADKNGYFEELGLDVDVQVYTNAMNRQSALQSGELDGAMTDVIALVNNVQNGFDIKVTTSTDGSFPILAKKNFQGQKDIKVGLMEVSVVNYLCDEFLSEEYKVEKIFINEIPARLEMINQGQIDMAVLPEPVASQGELMGLEKKIYESKDEFSPEIMVFTGDSIKNKEKAIKLFHKAYNKAVAEIQKDESIARDILVERLELNPEVKDKITLPKYNMARLPSQEYIEKIMKWNEEVLNKKIDLKYEELVEGKFVK
ncbi:sulfonate/nitrate/taurine transport system substrate-binding protein [Proteiniborus sp. DW1]|uniref:ABC transporter substrate-binding protein n=1 Tax=Proteiniborus sp. DW1 TaxID=1889883 RepID=UPI00092DEC38|nr:ABC transporter substrate-binding protein [Proteiniborus sp. DW1]SCG83788.1 sulfonate/nitrate/taurine transport system substrate-binding protein [Proteiniborus sp. DW1]